MPEPETATLKDGKLIDPRVTDKVNAKIEKGVLKTVAALIVHQTGGGSALSALESYKAGGNGAHFLIDRDGTIYQTARVTQRCWHVGEVQSRCYKFVSCSMDEMKDIKSILYQQGQSYGYRIGQLHKHEQLKSYPDRFPTNEDSLGIELVAKSTAEKGFDPATAEQNTSLAWLVETLARLLGFEREGNVFRHSEIGYKQSDEAATASW